MAITPMMQQYLQIKEQYPDTILFYRLGDFYEMFFEDAKLVSRELELTLTGKDCGLSERAPMCGVPYHAVEAYLSRLIEKGYKVAICEQMQDPAEAKGLVERAVTRVVTPGTVIESNMLEEKRANYILALDIQKNRAGCAFADVSTGEFYLYQIADARLHLADELARISPSEILTNDPEAFKRLLPDWARPAGRLDEERFSYAVAAKCLAAHFGESVKDMGFAEMRLAVSAAGALLSYLTETQKNDLSHIVKARLYTSGSFMALDRVALRNLELTETVRGKQRRGSLLWILDRTETSMGGRLLRSWIERPLLDKAAIEARLDAVEAFKEDPFARQALRESLSGVYDIERLLSKIAYETVNARDCLALRASLELIPRIQGQLNEIKAALVQETAKSLDPLQELTEKLRRAISPDAPLSVREGGMILGGYNEELDDLRDVAGHGKEYLSALEQREREATGIKNLKIGYNRVFGYYIEVTRSFYDLVPYNYTRKQTLANAERFITEELKQLEQRILGAEENAVRLEYQLFLGIREDLQAALTALQADAQALKTIDALIALAETAAELGYVRPKINDEGRYAIAGGRHPVVESAIGRERFVPNDTKLDAHDRVMIITGPNMAGKSTYMRQVALIVLMAHMGSFVPADEADIALTDRIFTRIGASDDLYGGQSTFMVEMSEMATILKFATEKSLLILDEVGRGTSTFDGLSIAWAAVEHIAGEKCRARTLFATHYHELSELEGQLEGVVNYRITAKEQGDDVIFLRKIVPGGADRSYGIEVATLAGLPKEVVSRAKAILAELERGKGYEVAPRREEDQISMSAIGEAEVLDALRRAQVETLTPIEAMQLLYELKQKLK